jgi:hypothetical protein
VTLVTGWRELRAELCSGHKPAGGVSLSVLLRLSGDVINLDIA